jgi:hypothetical protein
VLVVFEQAIARTVELLDASWLECLCHKRPMPGLCRLRRTETLRWSCEWNSKELVYAGLGDRYSGSNDNPTINSNSWVYCSHSSEPRQHGERVISHVFRALLLKGSNSVMLILWSRRGVGGLTIAIYTIGMLPYMHFTVTASIFDMFTRLQFDSVIPRLYSR